MTPSAAITPGRIDAAARSLSSLRPAYDGVIDLYRQIYSLQVEIEGRIDPDPIQISEKLVALKFNDGFPLIETHDFAWHADETTTCLEQLCEVLKQGRSELSYPARILLNALNNRQTDLPTLFKALLEGADSVLEEAADRLGIAQSTLAFFLYSALRPSIRQSARQLAGHLAHYMADPADWEKGYCPICGNPPGMAMFHEAGKRELCCSFCGHQWPARRLFCPFCETRDREQLSYFFSEDEPEYRVDLCDGCKKYIKGVDVRQTDRPVYPPLEQVCTLHLDFKAQKMGYASQIPLAM